MRLNTSVSVLFIIFISISCRQIRELQSFAKCDFRLSTVENTTLAGVNVQQVRNIRDLNFAQAAKITQSYASGSLPLNLIVNLQVKNPNASTAAMNSVDWIMLIDDKEIVDGTLNERIQIDPNGGVSTLPIKISADLRKILNSMPADQAVNMGLGLTGNGDKPTRITLKVKPSIMVGQTIVKYPGFIKVNQEFGASN